MNNCLNSCNANIIKQARRFSLSCKSCYPFKGELPDPQFKTLKARQANRPLNKENYKEVIEAQRKRRPWGLFKSFFNYHILLKVYKTVLCMETLTNRIIT